MSFKSFAHEIPQPIALLKWSAFRSYQLHHGLYSICTHQYKTRSACQLLFSTHGKAEALASDFTRDSEPDESASFSRKGFFMLCTSIFMLCASSATWGLLALSSELLSNFLIFINAKKAWWWNGRRCWLIVEGPILSFGWLRGVCSPTEFSPDSWLEVVWQH